MLTFIHWDNLCKVSQRIAQFLIKTLLMMLELLENTKVKKKENEHRSRTDGRMTKAAAFGSRTYVDHPFELGFF